MRIHNLQIEQEGPTGCGEVAVAGLQGGDPVFWGSMKHVQQYSDLKGEKTCIGTGTVFFFNF